MNIFTVRPLPTMIAAAIVALLGCARASAQSDVENAISYYGEDNIPGYIQPLADFLGTDINSGFFHSAAIAKEGFHISLDIIGTGATVSDDDKSFSAELPSGFEETHADMPTIVGGEATLVTDPSDAQYRGSNGMVDASFFAYPIVQVTAGSVMGTEGFIRFTTTPAVDDDKFPKTSLFGAGVRHSLSQYMVEPPIDIAASFSYNTMSVGDIMDVEGILIGAQASKAWDMFTLYGGVAWEQSTLTLEYTSTGDTPGAVAVELDGANTFRVTAGGLLQLGFFRLFGDVNVGSVTAFSGGIGFGM